MPWYCVHVEVEAEEEETARQRVDDCLEDDMEIVGLEEVE